MAPGNKERAPGGKVEHTNEELAPLLAPAESQRTEQSHEIDLAGVSTRELPAEVLANDFFSMNETRLGYKSRLTLAIRTALAGLEREASKLAGRPVEALRTEFLSIESRRQELRFVSEYRSTDYRVFLVLLITAFRTRKRF
jgi:hypothetical protein